MTLASLPLVIYRAKKHNSKANLKRAHKMFGLNEAVEILIRPYRLTYSKSDLGPQVVDSARGSLIREDFFLVNEQGHKLKCSHYFVQRKSFDVVCIYSHGSSGSRLQANRVLNFVTPNFNVITFDYAGCGQSDGDLITLGVREARDLRLVFDFSIKKLGYDSVLIWGRWFALEYRPLQLVAMVLDSPYADLAGLINYNISERYSLPSFLCSILTKLIHSQVEKELGMPIQPLNVVELVKGIKIKALFISSPDDKVVPISHVRELYDCWPSELRQFMEVGGEHHAVRTFSQGKDIQLYLAATVDEREQAKTKNDLQSKKMRLIGIKRVKSQPKSLLN